MRRTIMRGLVLAGVATLGLTGTGAAAGAAGGDHESPDPGSPSPGVTSPSPSTPDATPTSASPSPSRTPTTSAPARVRLHTTLAGARTSATGALARYTVRVRATGGVAHRVTAVIAVHPRAARFTMPAACHRGARIHCRLGDVHGARLLTFRQRPGHAVHRLTVAVTVTAANASAAQSTTALVLKSPPAHTVRQAVPRYVPPETITEREPRTIAVPVRPPETVFSTPDGAQKPLDQNLGAPAKPRLPVIAPRPGPRPTPNGAPVTVRPVADGHAITGAASGMPTRRILGLLAAAASFVGMVTALVLIRRRNEQ